MNNPGEIYLNLRRAIVRTYSKEIVAKEYFTFVSFVAQVLLIFHKQGERLSCEKSVSGLPQNYEEIQYPAIEAYAF